MQESRCNQCGESILPLSEDCIYCGAEDPTDEFIGRTIRGNLRIESLIGSGGMGNVYKGVETHLDRPVAVKVLNHLGLTSDRAVNYFFREAKVLSVLRHPNLVSVLDFGREADGTLFLVMEYIPGKTLEHLIVTSKSMQPSRVLPLLIQMASGLQEAHSHNIIHRDLKPGNILIENIAGMGEFVKILDFGIAKMLRQEPGVSQDGTAFGTAIGTPEYMSPEQAQGLELDGRSDIYSMGLLLFEMVTGTLPNASENVLSMLMKRTMEEIPPPSRVKPGLPPIIDELCGCATAIDRDVRYRSAAEFREALEDAITKLDRQPAEVPTARPATRAGYGRERAALGIVPFFLQNASTGYSTEARRRFEIHAFLEERVNAHGGELSTQPGGQHVAVFEAGEGAPIIRAVEVALSIRERGSRRFPFARFQIGIGIGEAVKNEGTLTGAAIEQSFNLARRALGNQIFATTYADALLEQAFEIRRWDNEIEIIGVRNAHLDAVVKATPAAIALPGDHAARASGFVGRPALRRILETRLSALLHDNVGSALLIEGPTGMGKSHALQYLRRRASDEGLLLLQCNCHPTLNTRPLAPLLNLAVQAAGLGSNITSPLSSEQLSPTKLIRGLTLLGLDEDNTNIIKDQCFALTNHDPWFVAFNAAGVMGYAQTARANHLFTHDERIQLFTGAMRSLLRKLTAAGGALVIFEDVELADEATRRTLAGLASLPASASAPLLLLATTNDGDALPTNDFERVPLEHLRGAELESFWTELCALTEARDRSLNPGAHQPRPTLQLQFTKSLLAASQGLPLYLARWLEAPTSVKTPTLAMTALLTEQLNALPNRLQRLILIAGVIGFYFEVSVLEALFPRSETLMAALEGAAACGFLQRSALSSGWWNFRSELLYEVVYNSIPAEARERYHLSIFKALKVNRLEHRALLAYQSHRAGVLVEAATLCTAQGDIFMVAGDAEVAIDLYQRALACRPPEVTELLLKAAAAALYTDAYETARVCLDAIPEPISPQHAGAHALMEVVTAIELGEERQALKKVDAALSRAKRTSRHSAALYAACGALLAHTGAHERAMKSFSVCVKITQRGEDKLPDDQQHIAWLAAMLRGRSAIALNRHQDAEKSWLFALNTAFKQNDNLNAVYTLTALSTLWLPKRPSALIKSCEVANTRLTLRSNHIATLIRLHGRALLAAGEHQRARTLLEQSISLTRELGWPAATEAAQALMSGAHQPEPRWPLREMLL